MGSEMCIRDRSAAQSNGSNRCAHARRISQKNGATRSIFRDHAAPSTRPITESNVEMVVSEISQGKPGGLSEIEMKFIWTIGIVCICYLLCSVPAALYVAGFTNRDYRIFYFVSGLTWIQYSINIFIYAYRSEQYRAAYWDVLVIIFPCIPKIKAKLGTK